MKFLQFGCWNNLNGSEGNLKGVMKYLEQRVKTPSEKPDFIIVSGDNYYPHKTKKDKTKDKDKDKDKTKDTKSKEKEDKTKKEKNTSTKTKTIFPSKLHEGLLLLPERIPIYMILGNHDLETNKEDNLFIETTEKAEQRDCKIIELELETLKNKSNVEYCFFKSEQIDATLILMLDTSIYEIDADKYLPCYKKFFATNPLYKDKNPVFETIDNLRDYQLLQINNAINKSKKLKHLIIVGHHPIYQLKNKIIEGKSNIEDKSDIHLSFTPVLTAIFTNLPPSTNYYYLCSDLHLYQKGLIELTIPDTRTMTIQQYIVGSGGTELDPAISSSTIEENYNHENIKYTFLQEKREHGVLECTIEENETPIFEFIPITSISIPLPPPPPPPPSGGKKYKRKSKKKTKKNYKKKSKKKSKKNYKKTHKK
jgi:predicted MPP superfamily phosphohydrolase